jgi:peroxiredoxin
MSGLRIGEPAPPFRLPSGQGGEVALEDYRGRQPVILWFTTGMACSFCRQQMAQLGRGYPELQARGAEILQVTPSPAAKARFYAQNFRLPFPYLCDPEYAAHRAYGLAVRSHGPLWYAQALAAGLRTPSAPPAIGTVKTELGDMPLLVRDTDMGVFVVDRRGVIQWMVAAPYNQMPDGVARAPLTTTPIPSQAELLAALERCA